MFYTNSNQHFIVNFYFVSGNNLFVLINVHWFSVAENKDLHVSAVSEVCGLFIVGDDLLFLLQWAQFRNLPGEV